MSVIETVETLTKEYAFKCDVEIAARSRGRFFKCGFCIRKYKYHSLLENHIYVQEIFHPVEKYRALSLTTFLV